MSYVYGIGIGLELEFYLFDRQLHNIGEIISKLMCEIILCQETLIKALIGR